ncbi:MAG TPA: molybdopterin dinucleotide binding domain-containing protein, partial [Acidimicrobiales bacterium]|nr:molybdopterin dinucleotide binding domain-containing protein [Acidimicrobiales bacterium]
SDAPPSGTGAGDTGTGSRETAATEEPAVIDPMGTPGLLETAAQGVPATEVTAARPEHLGSEGHDNGVPRPAFLALSAATDFSPPPVDAYSLRLVSHRTLYGKATMVQSSPSLAHLAPATTARANPHDLERLIGTDGSRLRVRSRRASLVLEVVADAGVPRGSISIPFNAVGADVGELIEAGRPVVEVRVETP